MSGYPGGATPKGVLGNFKMCYFGVLLKADVA